MCVISHIKRVAISTGRHLLIAHTTSRSVRADCSSLERYIRGLSVVLGRGVGGGRLAFVFFHAEGLLVHTHTCRGYTEDVTASW